MSKTATAYILPYLIKFIENYMPPWDYDYASEQELLQSSSDALHNCPESVIDWVSEFISENDEAYGEGQLIINIIKSLI